MTKIGEARVKSSGRAQGGGQRSISKSRELSERCAPCVPSRSVRHVARAIGTRSRPRRLKAVSFSGSVPSGAVVSTHT